jgi:hypothetical protein
VQTKNEGRTRFVGSEDPRHFRGGFVNIHRCVALSVLTAFAVAGCGGAADEEDKVLDQWLGESTHFAVSGTFEGKPMNIRLDGETAKGVKCTRSYAPLPGAKPNADGKYDTSQMYFVTKEISAVIEFDGVPTEFAVGYWRHDAPAGTTLEIIPRKQGNPIPEGQTWVDVEMGDPNVEGPAPINKAAETGTVSIKLNSGVADQGGVYIPSGGRAGEFLTLNWGPKENLKVSATADCEDSEVVLWASRVVPP